MDILDMADQQAETQLRASLSARREQGPTATGYCLNCDEPLPEGHRWCDAGCRNDWQKEYERSGNGG